MFYGWNIVIGAILTLSLLPPSAIALANLFQNAVTLDLGISNTQFALSNSLLHLMGIFFAPIISQRLVKNFKQTHLIGVIIYSVGFACYGIAQNIYMFYFISVIIGVAFQMATMIPISMLVTNWFVEKRGLALSIAVSGLGVGGAILSPLLTNMIAQLGWRSTYLVYGFVMVIVTVPISLFVFKEKPEDMGLEAYGAEKQLDTKNVTVKKAPSETVNISVLKSFKTPFFILLMLGTIGVGISNSAGLGQFPPFLQGLYGSGTAALLISVYSLVGIPGKIILGIFNDKFGIKLSIIYAGFALIAAYLIMMLAGMYPSVTWLAVVGAVLFGLGNANGTILNPLVTSSIYSTKDYGIAYGYMTSAMQIGMTSGSLIVASITDITKTFSLGWVVVGILTFSSIVFWIAALKNSRKYI